MFPLLLVSFLLTVAAGFANPVWWLASAVLLYLAVRFRQGYLSYDAEYRAYRERRIRQDRYDKRYRAERGGAAKGK
ncbi:MULTISPECIES: hypothetical protein [Streptomyces]|uniref:Uncharacterized protein n=3 Tax=Streptomyces TaxID=1883 RepID=A0A401W6B9_STREY|nr:MULTISPECIES: hypothetical protein [Streptomyces]GCD36685.1 hypothetical protein OEIGOIKO_04461 [Streptomyces chrestomyceticus JCM 4735]GCD44805.1 hypothetical protein GKJPGBOP_04519 [Streptomyces paromomycinus]